MVPVLAAQIEISDYLKEVIGKGCQICMKRGRYFSSELSRCLPVLLFCLRRSQD